ncbi:putative ubiquitin-conjugating enzyme [Aspergillus undulatus]|uniref:putative ubiquitin-conjugating enzyme n=1 Tax=Aspergillus undulatus TaxID=1810928 RepID=UPI003CCD816F
MSTTRLPSIPSLRRYQLLQEHASLKQAAPPGVYVSLNPCDPSLWACVIFVRTGPYGSAILRFQIRFPPDYPDRPPLVTFSTDVFHPLIVPLTTYTFSTGVSNENPVSATDEERLPPGGFSLRHAFPQWFGRARRGDVGPVRSSRAVSLNGSKNAPAEATEANAPAHETADTETTPTEGGEVEAVEAPPAEAPVKTRTSIPVLEILDYIRTSFDDETVLDSVPLEAAGNPSAWHAWKAHRKDSDSPAVTDASKRDNPQARLPGDWHWDGIWTRRVEYEIEASRSDATLFGNAARGSDEMIRFNRLDGDALASIKQMVIPPVEETSRENLPKS